MRPVGRIGGGSTEGNGTKHPSPPSHPRVPDASACQLFLQHRQGGPRQARSKFFRLELNLASQYLAPLPTSTYWCLKSPSPPLWNRNHTPPVSKYLPGASPKDAFQLSFRVNLIQFSKCRH